MSEEGWFGLGALAVLVTGAALGISAWIVVPAAIALGALAARYLPTRRPEPPPPVDPNTKPHTKIAVEFASALVDGEFTRAHALMTPELQNALTPDGLRRSLDEMISYGEGPAERIWFDYYACVNEEDWPARKTDEVALVYVGIEGDRFIEAVTVTVAKLGDDHRISDVEWGRP